MTVTIAKFADGENVYVVSQRTNTPWFTGCRQLR
jgi:hypothetical protein